MINTDCKEIIIKDKKYVRRITPDKGIVCFSVFRYVKYNGFYQWDYQTLISKEDMQNVLKSK